MVTAFGRVTTLRMTWTNGPDGSSYPVAPMADMYLVFSERTAYVVQSVRPMLRSPRPNRYSMRCMRVNPKDVPSDGMVIPCYWEPRKQK